MHPVPITCLCLNEDRMIISGSTSGDIRISDPSSVQQVATLRSSDVRGKNVSLLIGICWLMSREEKTKRQWMNSVCFDYTFCYTYIYTHIY